MRYFSKKLFNSLRRRYESERYSEWVITEVLSSFQLNYSIDTWKLPDFERVLLGIKDFVDQPTSWRSLAYYTLYLGKELHIFVVTLYMYFLSSRSLAHSWQWMEWADNIRLSDYYVIDLDEIDLNFPEDFTTSFFYTTFVFHYRNENTPLLIWEHKFSDFFAIFYYFWAFLTGTGSKMSSKLLDLFFFVNSRYSYRVSTFLNFTNFYLTNIFSICKKSISVLNFSRTVNQKPFIFLKKIENSRLFWFINLLKSSNKENFFLKKLNHVALLKPIVFDNTTTVKQLATLLRKQRVFTKSKYARSRQYCKNIVLIGLLLNIILMYGLNSNYYAILINLGYFIYPLYIIMIFFSVFFFVKFKLYNVFKTC